ncbi:MAG: LysE family transporter [Verrucomicrobia bacterium]|nr:LysE family transporter [Verrucomicrobiota bacterium]
MSDWIPPLVLSFVLGAGFGFIAQMPVGPVNITILHEGMRRGFRWALLIGAGATAMEAVYCLIGFAGFSGLFTTRMMKAAMELITFSLMFFLGLKYLLARALPAVSKSETVIEHKLHPHTAFWTGFVRVMGNPNVLLFLITLSATFVSHDWVNSTWTSKGVCVAGVTAGTGGWFALLAFAASRGHGRVSDGTLLAMSRVSGALLLAVSLVIGWKLANLLEHHQ